MSGPLQLAALAAASERPLLGAAASQLGEALAAAGYVWPVRLDYFDSVEAIDLAKPPQAAIVSLLDALHPAEVPLARIEERLRDGCKKLLDGGVPAVVLTTIFRVTDRPELLERIRRLNLLAAEISHDTGALVADIDRVFAHVGAQRLETDYRHAGTLAAEIGAYTIVEALLAMGLEDVVPPEACERAQRFQGSIWQIHELLNRRLKSNRYGVR